MESAKSGENQRSEWHVGRNLLASLTIAANTAEFRIENQGNRTIEIAGFLDDPKFVSNLLLVEILGSQGKDLLLRKIDGTLKGGVTSDFFTIVPRPLEPGGFVAVQVELYFVARLLEGGLPPSSEGLGGKLARIKVPLELNWLGQKGSGRLEFTTPWFQVQ